MVTNEELIKIAKEVSYNAYCPYSKFPVGACALFESGKYYVGCNIENSSYGLSLCAERNAISTAIANGETSNLLKIAIYSPMSSECFPCGACRQVMFEFQGENEISVITESQGNLITRKMSDFLPYGFRI